MGYDRVAQTLAGLTRDGDFLIDIGCGVGTWSIEVLHLETPLMKCYA